LALEVTSVKTLLLGMVMMLWSSVFMRTLRRPILMMSPYSPP
jgi:hypothetical protein